MDPRAASTGRLRRALGAMLRSMCLPGPFGYASAPATTRRTGLAICPLCGADMVCPLEWEPVEEHGWTMWLRCGECASAREVVVTNAEADEFDKALQAHREAIERALAEMADPRRPLT